MKTVYEVEKEDLENIGRGYYISSDRLQELNEILENRPMPLQVIQMILEESSSWDDFINIIENNNYSYLDNVVTDEELGTQIDDELIPEINMELLKESGAYKYLDREQIGIMLQAQYQWVIYVNYQMAIQIHR